MRLRKQKPTPAITARKAVEAAKEKLALRPSMDAALALQAAQRALKEATELRLISL